MAEPRSRRKLAAILSADVVGYSRMMAANEAATVETLKFYRDIIGRLVARRGGRVVNAPGDALLAEFPSAVEAVQAAIEIQKVLEGHNIQLEPERRMQFRIGVNLGDVIEEADGTIYGDGVNIAARMEALAEGGGVCISSTVYDAVEGKLALGFDFLGEQQVKNIAKPIRVYRVRAEPKPPSARPRQSGACDGRSPYRPWP
jgi:class 3 adenylate cyclase